MVTPQLGIQYFLLVFCTQQALRLGLPFTKKEKGAQVNEGIYQLASASIEI